MLLFLLCLLCFSQALAQTVSFGRSSYTGVVYRGNTVLVFNSSEGVEMHVRYDQDTQVNIASWNATKQATMPP